MALYNADLNVSGTLTIPSGIFSDSVTISGASILTSDSVVGGGSALTVKEADGAPTVANVDTIVVTDGTLTDDGGGQVTISTGGSGGGGSATASGSYWLADAPPVDPSPFDDEFDTFGQEANQDSAEPIDPAVWTEWDPGATVNTRDKFGEGIGPDGFGFSTGSVPNVWGGWVRDLAPMVATVSGGGSWWVDTKVKVGERESKELWTGIAIGGDLIGSPTTEEILYIALVNNSTSPGVLNDSQGYVSTVSNGVVYNSAISTNAQSTDSSGPMPTDMYLRIGYGGPADEFYAMYSTDGSTWSILTNDGNLLASGTLNFLPQYVGLVGRAEDAGGSVHRFQYFRFRTNQDRNAAASRITIARLPLLGRRVDADQGLTGGGGVTDPLVLASGVFSESLTISGVPVSTGTGGGGASTLQEAYDGGDGTISTTGGKPLELTGTGELTAVTGTFTEGLTVGTGSTVINDHEIATSSGTFQNLTVSGVPVVTTATPTNVAWQTLDTAFSPVALWTLNGDRTVQIPGGGNSVDFSIDGGTEFYTTPGYPGFQMFRFDGSTKLQAGTATSDLVITGDLTLEVVLLIDAAPSEEVIVVIQGGTGGGGETDNVLHQIDITTLNEIKWNTMSGNQVQDPYTFTTVRFPIGEPVHLCCVRENDFISLYFNGILVETSTQLNTPTGGSDTDFRVGGQRNTFNKLQDGSAVGSVKVIGRALTALEVKAESDRVFSISPFGPEAPGRVVAASGIFSESLTVSGVPVNIGAGGGSGTITDINTVATGPSVTITGAGNVETITAGNVITVSGVSDLALGSSIVFIREVTLSADAATLDIVNIPQEASNLVIEFALRSNRADISDTSQITFNDDTGTNYDSSWRGFYADGTSNQSALDGVGLTHIRALSTAGGNTPANYMGTGTMNLQGYSRTDVTKPLQGTGFYSEGTSTDAQQRTNIAGGQWRSTAAINKITFTPGAGTLWEAGSSVTVYGMASEIAVFTENIVSASGTFTQSLTVSGVPVSIGLPFADNSFKKLFQVADIQPNGTGQLGITAGSWVTRRLNTVVNDNVEGASLASDQITLPAGTYFADWTAPGYFVGLQASRIYDTTHSTELIISTGGFDNTSTVLTNTLGAGKFTLDEESVLELQHRVSVTNGTNGLGAAVSFGSDEVYANIRIWDVGFQGVSIDDLQSVSGTFTQSLTISGTPVNIDFSSGFRGALMAVSSGTSIPNDAAVSIAWDTVSYDTDSFYSADQPTRLTIPAGVNKVRLSTVFRYTQSVNGDRRIIMRKNGSGSLSLDPNEGQVVFQVEAHSAEDVGTGTVMEATTPIMEVSEGDYFETFGRQGSGGALDLIPEAMWWQIEVVDPTAAQNPAEVFAVSGTFTQSLTVSGTPVSIGSGGLQNVVEDTTPQLGGNLDAQSNDITAVNEITAVTGTFTGGITIGGASTFIDGGSITTTTGVVTELTVSGTATFGQEDAVASGTNIIFASQDTEQLVTASPQDVNCETAPLENGVEYLVIYAGNAGGEFTTQNAGLNILFGATKYGICNHRRGTLGTFGANHYNAAATNGIFKVTGDGSSTVKFQGTRTGIATTYVGAMSIICVPLDRFVEGTDYFYAQNANSDAFDLTDIAISDPPTTSLLSSTFTSMAAGDWLFLWSDEGAAAIFASDAYATRFQVDSNTIGPARWGRRNDQSTSTCQLTWAGANVVNIPVGGNIPVEILCGSLESAESNWRRGRIFAIKTSLFTQVLSTTDSTGLATASASFQDFTGLNTSITPNNVDSPIIVFTSATSYTEDVNSGFTSAIRNETAGINYRIDSGDRNEGVGGGGASTIDLNNSFMAHFEERSVPTEYRYQFRSEGSGEVSVGRNDDDTGGELSEMIVWEFALADAPFVPITQTVIADLDISTGALISDQIDARVGLTVSGVPVATGTGGGGTSDHASLDNLDFASAGHTGFASEAELLTVSGGLQTQIDAGAAPTTISGIIGNKLNVTTISGVALYLFDDNLTDSSGNGLDLSLGAGAERYTNVNGLRSVKMDGNSYFRFTPGSTALEITGDITIQLLLTTDEHVGTGYMLSYAGGGDAENVNALFSGRVASASEHYQWFSESGAGVDASYGAWAGTGNQNIHLVTFVRESDVVTLYIDGAERGSSGALATPTGGTSSFLDIGAFDGTNIYRGTIACVKIVDSALTATQVYDEYKTTWATLV